MSRFRDVRQVPEVRDELSRRIDWSDGALEVLEDHPDPLEARVNTIPGTCAAPAALMRNVIFARLEADIGADHCEITSGWRVNDSISLVVHPDGTSSGRCCPSTFRVSARGSSPSRSSTSMRWLMARGWTDDAHRTVATTEVVPVSAVDTVGRYALPVNPLETRDDSAPHYEPPAEARDALPACHQHRPVEESA